MQHSAHLWPARLKEHPEDFQVEEEITLAPGGSGAYRLYRLSKRGWGTEELARHLAHRLGLPRAAIAYGGRKDRRAVAVQHLTIRGRKDRSLSWEGFELRSLGFVERPMTPQDIAANHFSLRLRGLDPRCQATVTRNAAAVSRHGVPNYFDDQRFRSLRQYGEHPAERLVRGEWEAALRLLLTCPPPGSPRPLRERLAQLRAAWGRWEECLALAASPQHRRAVAELATGRVAAAFRQFPPAELSLLLTAYQSHLWNLALRRAVASCGDTVELPGASGGYLFPLPGAAGEGSLASLAIPTPARRLAPGCPEGEALIRTVLTELGHSLASFSLRRLAHAYFSSTLRRAAVVPRDLTLTWLGSPTAGGEELRLTFTLSPGAYATMVVRGLLLRAPVRDESSFSANDSPHQRW